MPNGGEETDKIPDLHEFLHEESHIGGGDGVEHFDAGELLSPVTRAEILEEQCDGDLYKTAVVSMERKG